MNAFLLVSVVLMVVALLMAVMVFGRFASERSRVSKRITGGTASSDIEDRWSLQVLGRLKDPEAIREHIEKDSELSRMLWQAGLRSTSQKAAYYLMSIAAPVLLFLLALAYHFLAGKGFQNPLLAFLAIVIVGVLLPKRIVGLMASTRKQRIVAEVSVYIQVLKILFDAGLAIEQALRVIATEARTALPEISKELDSVLRRTASGLDLAQELDHNAHLLEVEEYTDVVSILKQMIRQGGSARSSLSKLSDLLEDRRMTTLKERVNKLSAKMTMVMIIFMFPALLILIAAPGFMAISKALGNL